MTAGTPGNSTADLLQALSADLSSLVRQEFRQAQQELADKAKQAGKAGVLLGGAAVLGTMAIGTSAALVVRLLEHRFSPTTSAVLATALFAAGAGGLAVAGREQLRLASPLVPEGTVASLREDARAATDGLTSP